MKESKFENHDEEEKVKGSEKEQVTKVKGIREGRESQIVEVTTKSGHHLWVRWVGGKTEEITLAYGEPVQIGENSKAEIVRLVTEYMKAQTLTEGTSEWWAARCPSLRKSGLWVEYHPNQKGIEIGVPSAGRGASSARYVLRTEAAEKVAFLMEGFNSRRSEGSITGPGVVWSYADGHGMKLGAVLKRGSKSVMWLPGHHGHGPGQTCDVLANDDGTVTVTERKR